MSAQGNNEAIELLRSMEATQAEQLRQLTSLASDIRTLTTRVKHIDNSRIIRAPTWGVMWGILAAAVVMPAWSILVAIVYLPVALMLWPILRVLSQ